jgi:hypothetical protein
MVVGSTYTVYTASPFSTLLPTSTHSAHTGPTLSPRSVISDQTHEQYASGRKRPDGRIVKGMKNSRRGVGNRMRSKLQKRHDAFKTSLTG